MASIEDCNLQYKRVLCSHHGAGTPSPALPQANMGAKNHAVIMPDANLDSTVAALTGAAFGAAGQRCMAISAAVFVGGMAPAFKEALIAKARGLRVTAGWEAGADVGPLISREARARVERLVESSVRQGATAALDGRGVSVPGYPDGNFVGPTLLTGVTPEMDAYREEVFGPVLVCLEVDTLDEVRAGGASCFLLSLGARCSTSQPRAQSPWSLLSEGRAPPPPSPLPSPALSSPPPPPARRCG